MQIAMKNTQIKYLTAAIAITILSSCDKFLEEKSQDLYIPKTIQDYKELIAGEGLGLGNKSIALSEFLDAMSDDTGEYVNPRRKEYEDSRNRYWGYYTWQKDPEVMENSSIQTDISWNTYYHRILLSNIILSDIDKISGPDNERNDVKAEAYFLRAWSYFMLVNSYAEPYTTREEAEKKPGLPLNTNTDVEKERNLEIVSIAKIYDIINSDLDMAINLFSEQKIKKSFLRPGLDAALLLRSRSALYTKDYAEVVSTVKKLMQTTDHKLFDIKSFTSQMRFINETNTEILFSYGEYKLTDFIKASPSAKGCYVVSKDFYNLYSSSDARKKVFFTQSAPRIKPFKYYNLASKGVKGYAMRLGEALLNRAEAQYYLGEYDEAKKDIELLRSYRLKGSAEITPSNNDELLEAIRLERRLELCFEGHRWFDLRRYGCPSITHKYSSSDNASDFVIHKLEEKDKRYTLPFPRAERNL